jgi:16S rRNA (cytosine1402-N4)-methyltransferase
VLRDAALDNLLTPTGRVYVDGTLGGGGHAEEICRRMDPTATLICMDADEDAIQFAKKRLIALNRPVVFVHSNFKSLGLELRSRNIHFVDGLLLDLGVSSFQLDSPSRGFSFRSDGEIDMRLDTRQEKTGRNVVNEYSEQQLANVLWKYGDERNSRRIARAIVRRRPIDSTGALCEAVRSATGERFLVKTLARVFQAIRIEVNDELGSLDRVLNDALPMLSPGGRMVVISYHSLEDRIVKDFFKMNSASVVRSGHKFVPDTITTPTLKTITRKPIIPDDEEVRRNPRARSARLRAAERLTVGA